MEIEDVTCTLDIQTEYNTTPEFCILIINNDLQQEIQEARYCVTESLEQGSCFTTGLFFFV